MISAAMTPRSRWMLLAGITLLQGGAACFTGGPETSQLNPQPLPPRDDEKESGDRSEAPSSAGGESSSGGLGGGTSGAAPMNGADAGAPDASDSGDQ